MAHPSIGHPQMVENARLTSRPRLLTPIAQSTELPSPSPGEIAKTKPICCLYSTIVNRSPVKTNLHPLLSDRTVTWLTDGCQACPGVINKQDRPSYLSPYS